MICDGGYHSWYFLMCPYKHQHEGTDEMIWSHMIESVRKDIECVFGILKKRFMILKYALRVHELETVGKIFRTCCILHNMLHEYDGYDDWNEGSNLDEDHVDVE